MIDWGDPECPLHRNLGGDSDRLEVAASGLIVDRRSSTLSGPRGNSEAVIENDATGRSGGGDEAPQPLLGLDVHVKGQGSHPPAARRYGRPSAPSTSRPPIRRSRPSRPTSSTNASRGSHHRRRSPARPGGLARACARKPARDHLGVRAARNCHYKRAEQPVATESRRLTLATTPSTLRLTRLKWLSFHGNPVQTTR